MSFFFKQFNKYKSVIQLVHLNQNSDATVIARVMLEGFFYLLWAKLNPERRAKDWRSYALVSDYKLFLQNKYKGKQISLDEETELINRVKIECDQFLTSNGKKAIEKGEELSKDSFRTKWLVTENGKSIPIEDIFSELGSNDLLELYSDMCDWVHWNPRGIGTKIERRDNKISFLENPPNDAATALAAGFHSLYQLTEIVNNYFSMKFDVRLKKIREKYIEELKSVNT